MTEGNKATNRRISGRVEEIVNGWWRLDEKDKFKRCKTLDVSMNGSLIVLDELLPENSEIELHLDMEEDWSMALEARILWQRPIFFGKQHLTAVTFKFRRSEDRSMFGLWMQRRISEGAETKEDHLAPVSLNEPKKDFEPSIERAPKIHYKESGWKRRLSQLTSKIPWGESDPLPNERRKESRGQIGLSVRCESPDGSFEGSLLNVSISGACVFVPQRDERSSGGLMNLIQKGGSFSPGRTLELVIPESSLLLGSNRVRVEVVWSLRAEVERAQRLEGSMVGLQFVSKPKETKKTFVGDLLRRINYNPKQVRSELRFPRKIPLLVITDDKSALKGFSLDLSAGGARAVLQEVLETPANVRVILDLSAEGDQSELVTFSARLLRHMVDNEGRNCYAVAFRKGQSEEHLVLSHWLAGQMRIQDLEDLIPNFDRGQENDSV